MADSHRAEAEARWYGVPRDGAEEWSATEAMRAAHGASGHTGETLRADAAGMPAPEVVIGQVVAYDAGSGTATVRAPGLPARLLGPLPVTATLPRDATVAGAACLVVILDAHNPADGVVAAMWGDAATTLGLALGAKLTQAGVVTLAVAGASSAAASVAFATPYAHAPVVVATSGDAAWTASVSAIDAAGFTLAILSATPASGTVTVQWLACGV